MGAHIGQFSNSSKFLISTLQWNGMALKNVNNCLNTNIYSYLETSGGQSSNLYLNVVHFFNASVNWTPLAAYDNYFPGLVSYMCCSIEIY
jgi:hypothetical protein